MVRLSNNHLVNCHTYRKENDVSQRTDDGTSSFMYVMQQMLRLHARILIIYAKRDIWYVPETKDHLYEPAADVEPAES